MIAIILLLLCFSLLCFITAVKIVKRNKESANTPISTASIDDNIKNIVANMVDMREISGMAEQLLGTIIIIEESINPDTVIDRCKFCNKLFRKYISNMDKINFATALEYGFSNYMEKYTARKDDITNERAIIMDIVKNSNEQEFYTRNIIRAMNGYINKIENEICSLKTKKAKERRVFMLEAMQRKVDDYVGLHTSTNTYQECLHGKIEHVK